MQTADILILLLPTGYTSNLLLPTGYTSNLLLPTGYTSNLLLPTGYTSNLLMQTWVLQSCVLLLTSTQSAPPYWGAGLVQVLKRSWVPPPHVTVQVPQEPQEAHRPSTTKNNQFPLYCPPYEIQMLHTDEIQM